MKPQIILEKISKSYGNRKVLDGLSFKVDEGKFVGLVGNNGCGKTTTINILCNIIPKESGELIILDEIIEPGKVDFKQNLGIVLSAPYYIPEFTVHKYLQFVCRFQGIKRSDVARRIEDLATLLDLRQYVRVPIKKLSSGLQMKVNLAAALIHNPKILIMDEPFVNLDTDTSQRLLKVLDSFKGKKTALITSHNLDLISSLCDEFLILENGRIILDLKKDDFKSVSELKKAITQNLVTDREIDEVPWLK